jgi:hypothetical protein
VRLLGRKLLEIRRQSMLKSEISPPHIYYPPVPTTKLEEEPSKFGDEELKQAKDRVATLQREVEELRARIKAKDLREGTSSPKDDIVHPVPLSTTIGFPESRRFSFCNSTTPLLKAFQSQELHYKAASLLFTSRFHIFSFDYFSSRSLSTQRTKGATSVYISAYSSKPSKANNISPRESGLSQG